MMTAETGRLDHKSLLTSDGLVALANWATGDALPKTFCTKRDSGADRTPRSAVVSHQSNSTTSSVVCWIGAFHLCS